MPTFINLKGKLAPLDIQNLDTDMIIPKEYLKTIKRTGTHPDSHCGFC
jgi:3-isopropylmalate dehydratase